LSQYLAIATPIGLTETQSTPNPECHNDRQAVYGKRTYKFVLMKVSIVILRLI